MAKIQIIQLELGSNKVRRTSNLTSTSRSTWTFSVIARGSAAKIDQAICRRCSAFVTTSVIAIDRKPPCHAVLGVAQSHANVVWIFSDSHSASLAVAFFSALPVLAATATAATATAATATAAAAAAGAAGAAAAFRFEFNIDFGLAVLNMQLDDEPEMYLRTLRLLA
jgi:hypothetical protein